MGHKADLLLSFGRAKDTCSVSLKKTGREAVTCDWLKEFYYRVWDEEVKQWTIAWDFYPRDFNHRDDFHDKDLWAQDRDNEVRRYRKSMLRKYMTALMHFSKSTAIREMTKATTML